MWGALLAGAFFTAINPVRLAILALLIGRPRPLANLLAYWFGAWMVGIPTLLVPLLLLNSTPVVASARDGFFSSTLYRQVQFGLGLLVIAIALVLVARSVSRRRKRVVSVGGGTDVDAPPTDQPSPLDRLFRHGRTESGERNSPFARIMGKAGDAWDSGALWIAVVVGAITGGPSLDGVFMGLAIIMTSGNSLGTQVIASVVWVFAMLIIIEVILLSLAFSPSKAQGVLESAHLFLQSQRQKILIAIFFVVGFALVLQNVSSVWGPT